MSCARDSAKIKKSWGLYRTNEMVRSLGKVNTEALQRYHNESKGISALIMTSNFKISTQTSPFLELLQTLEVLKFYA